MQLLSLQEQTTDQTSKTKKIRKPGMQKLTSKRAAGSRRNKKRPTVRTFVSDHLSKAALPFDYGLKANHAERAVDIKDVFESALKSLPQFPMHDNCDHQH